MGNLVLHSVEEPDNLRATTGTVEVPTKRDNDVALAPGARPIQQHENAARHMSSVTNVNEPVLRGSNRMNRIVGIKNVSLLASAIRDTLSYRGESTLLDQSGTDTSHHSVAR